MQRAVSLVNLMITGSYIIFLILYVFRPAQNAGSTRMLMFAFLANIPVVFMLAMIGGCDRWPVLYEGLKTVGQTGASGIAVVIGVIFLLVVMPAGMLVGIWYGLGLKFGTMFLLFFVPLILRLTLTPAGSSVRMAVYQALLCFGSFFAGFVLVRLLSAMRVELEPYIRNVQTVWPDYGDAAILFFATWVFAILHQIMEFKYALTELFRRG